MTVHFLRLRKLKHTIPPHNHGKNPSYVCVHSRLVAQQLMRKVRLAIKNAIDETQTTTIKFIKLITSCNHRMT